MYLRCRADHLLVGPKIGPSLVPEIPDRTGEIQVPVHAVMCSARPAIATASRDLLHHSTCLLDAPPLRPAVRLVVAGQRYRSSAPAQYCPGIPSIGAHNMLVRDHDTNRGAPHAVGDHRSRQRCLCGASGPHRRLQAPQEGHALHDPHGLLLGEFASLLGARHVRGDGLLQLVLHLLDGLVVLRRTSVAATAGRAVGGATTVDHVLGGLALLLEVGDGEVVRDVGSRLLLEGQELALILRITHHRVHVVVCPHERLCHGVDLYALRILGSPQPPQLCLRLPGDVLPAEVCDLPSSVPVEDTKQRELFTVAVPVPQACCGEVGVLHAHSPTLHRTAAPIETISGTRL
mmetsp:Transcript_51615/g.135441  ORF Transcript_51615/g.135441 Transcript_51615/m.135441 type:complete len:346 (-) Transcript_51615:152-1189(-)